MTTSTPDASPMRILLDVVRERAAAAPSEPGDARLKSLIDTAITEWQEDHRRGHRDIDLGDSDALAERIFRDLTGYGPITSLLEDEDVWEIMINSPRDIFVRRHSGPAGYHDETFLDDDHVVRTLARLLDESGNSHRSLDPSEGLQDAQLSDGSRVHIVHADLARGGHTIVNIRRFTGVPYVDLGELVELQMLSRDAARFLATTANADASILIAGAPGSGKTTLLSCCAAELDPTRRVVVAEEVFEIDIPLANVAQMQTRGRLADRAPIDLRQLVAGFLRMAPDVAIVGEVRDREALPLLLTMSSGVRGFATIHASSARQALSRLRFITQLNDAADLPLDALNHLISESIDLVVYCERTSLGPRVMTMLAVEDLTSGHGAAQLTTTPLFERCRPDAEITPTGQLPGRLSDKLARAGHDTRRLLGQR